VSNLQAKKLQKYHIQSGPEKTYNVLQMITFEPFATQLSCLHQNAWQIILTTNKQILNIKLNIFVKQPESVTYQQDCVPLHKLKHTVAFLQTNISDFTELPNWPPNSPDLNPVD